MLKLENLSCGYGSVEAVHDVSFDVPAGSVFALLGPNGAGKTSTIMAIMGHVDIHGGRILLEGADITRRRAIDRVGLGISLVPEGRQLFSDLTVDENLTAGGYARPLRRGRRETRSRIWHISRGCTSGGPSLAGSLSGGEQQMLAIGRALMAEPRLLLVDELSLGLMPKMVDLCLDALDAVEARRPDHRAGRAEHRSRARCRRQGLRAVVGRAGLPGHGGRSQGGRLDVRDVPRHGRAGRVID